MRTEAIYSEFASSKGVSHLHLCLVERLKGRGSGKLYSEKGESFRCAQKGSVGIRKLEVG